MLSPHRNIVFNEVSLRMREQRSKLSRAAPVIKPIDYMLKRWSDFARFVDDGRICLTNNAAERALRGLALGRKAWLFAGSDRGAERAAVMFTLIMTAKLNDVDPQAWLADVFARIASLPQSRLHELLPWQWKTLPSARRGLIVAAITRVYTVRLAAKILGRVEELLWELADQLEPENGMLWKDLIAACIRHVTFASLRMT
jgi:hypothetical protein